MSKRKNPRKLSQVKNKSEATPRKKIKKEEPKTETPTEETTPPKQPIVAPNGKIFYPCQYCSKIFPQKTTIITHMKKCPKQQENGNNNNNQIEKKEIEIDIVEEDLASSPKQQKNGNNNSQTNKKEIDIVEEDLDSSGSSTENKAPNKKQKEKPEINIIKNITVMPEPSNDPITATSKADTSIYDYDDDDPVESKSDNPKEDSSESENHKTCKHCKTVFENPMDLLRHTRDCHNFPRTILPPDEIEKYFDSPNRNFCPVCEKPIKTRNFRSVFIKHLLVHTTGLTHECRICKKKFRRRDHMRSHEKRHIVPV